MPRPFDRTLTALTAIAALLLSACVESGGVRMAGTSTSVGTSIGGTALLADGSPAAGAKVTARSDEMDYRNGKPEGLLLDSAVADHRGVFAFPTLKERDFFLEIECDPARACPNARTPEVFLREFRVEGKESLGTLRTQVPGGFRGTLNDTSGSLDSTLWLGIPGTAHFARWEDANDPGRPHLKTFRLDGLYPGRYVLSVVAPSDTGNPAARKTGSFPVISGSITDIGFDP
ncbi:MAG: hypothetical protein JWO30_4144 [Fibrobacteres bacterium]|nr:hypothetical protein [Fibrobacterota bacterium]